MTTCFECDALATQDHHVIPRLHGGTRTVPLCDDCHGKVHGRCAMDVSTLTALALARKKAKGERIGPPPYGFQVAEDGIHLEEEPQEQRVLDVIQRLHAQGESIRAIARTLEKYAVPARGSKWHPTTVARILAR